MKKYPYKDYEDYVKNQVEANLAKPNNVWVHRKTLGKIRMYHPNPKPGNILCHGTRNGKELELFKFFYPHARILGTEISPSAKNYANTVQHDFNTPKEEWIGKWDIIYSNSFDHCYDPVATLNVWKEQLALPHGHLYIEQSCLESDNTATAWDPLEISQDEIKDLFKEVGLRLVRTFECVGMRIKIPTVIHMLKI